MGNKVIPTELDWTEGKVKNFFGKDLLKQENGTVKLVKVAPNSKYPEHLHPDKTEYVYVLKGNPQFHIGTEEFNAAPDEFYIFPANIKHAILNNSDKECLLIVGAIKA